jgi:hypothetical protein
VTECDANPVGVGDISLGACAPRGQDSAAVCLRQFRYLFERGLRRSELPGATRPQANVHAHRSCARAESRSTRRPQLSGRLSPGHDIKLRSCKSDARVSMRCCEAAPAPAVQQAHISRVRNWHGLRKIPNLIAVTTVPRADEYGTAGPLCRD